MLHISAEELGEHDAHNQEGEQGRENAPEHAEIGSLIFLIEIALYKLREQKSVLTDALDERGNFSFHRYLHSVALGDRSAYK